MGLCRIGLIIIDIIVRDTLGATLKNRHPTPPKLSHYKAFLKLFHLKKNRLSSFEFIFSDIITLLIVNFVRPSNHCNVTKICLELSVEKWKRRLIHQYNDYFKIKQFRDPSV